MEAIMNNLSLLLPLLILQAALDIFALVNMVKNKNVKTLNIPLWILIILIFPTIGAIFYFILGRGDN